MDVEDLTETKLEMSFAQWVKLIGILAVIITGYNSLRWHVADLDGKVAELDRLVKKVRNEQLVRTGAIERLNKLSDRVRELEMLQ
jgi:hypothetical protein